MKFICSSILLLVCSFVVTAQSYKLELFDSGINSSFRSMSVVNDSVAWLGGSNGWIGITVDGAKTWSFFQVKGKEGQDFRSIYAFDEKKAVIVNAG